VEKGSGHPLHAGGFEGVVHFLFNGPGKLLDDFHRPVVGQFFDVAFGQGGQVEHDLQVHLHDFANSRPLDLDRHLIPVFETGPVDLADGGRRQGFGIEPVEQIIDAMAGLIADNSTDVGEGKGGNLVLEPGQFTDKIHGNQVRTGRKDLAHLDVSGPQLLDGQPHPHCTGEALHAFAALAGDHLKTDLDVLIDLQQLHDIIETIFEKYRQNLPITVQVSIGAADDANFTYADHPGRFRAFPRRPGC
jgi:hypothetical protein